MISENKALGLAPMIAPFAFAFFAYFADISGFNMDEGFLKFLTLFVGLFLVSLPFAYVYMFFIGYRFYQLLCKKKRVNLFTLSLGGIFVADIPMLLLWPFANDEGSISFYLIFQLFSFVGFMIGLNFWFLLNYERIKAKLFK